MKIDNIIPGIIREDIKQNNLCWKSIIHKDRISDSLSIEKFIMLIYKTRLHHNDNLIASLLYYK